MPQAEFIICRPSAINESKSIALKMKEGNPILLDMVELSSEERVRVSDYLRGAAQVLNVTFRPINACQVLLLAAEQDGGIDELAD